MDLQKHYTDLWESSFKKFSVGEFEQDVLIDSVDDNRYGLTLRARPDQTILAEFHKFTNNLNEQNAQQYYYPVSDLHITVLSIISCYPGFNLSADNVSAYSALIRNIIQDIPCFKVDFKGITASSSTIMIQGFPADNSLQRLRDKLRLGFRSSGLEQTIDKRYIIKTAHSTVVRFRSVPARLPAYLQTLQDYRNYHFGTTNISTLELVHNDWYHQKANLLGVFNLKD